MPGHEIQTLTSKLPFSDDSFKVYSCRAVRNDDGAILYEDKVEFFYREKCLLPVREMTSTPKVVAESGNT